MNSSSSQLQIKPLDLGIQCFFKAMGGQGELRLHDRHQSQLDLEKIAKVCVEEVVRIEQKYSRYLPSSVISLINQASGIQSTPIDAETFELLTFANELFKSSQGLFDITSGILRRVWDFKSKRIPSKEEIDQLLPLISWPSVRLDSQEIYLPQKSMEIDLGGFGKEYAADRVAKILTESNIQSGFINLSGDIKVIGPKLDNSAWQMGIQNPRQSHQLLASIPIHQGALATSGDYERFFSVGNKRYCHILRPDTGLPVNHWQSVSVVAPLAIVAGSCSTITMLLQEEGLTYLNNTGFSYLAIDSQGQVHQK